jgi:hypothetical protein
MVCHTRDFEVGPGVPHQGSKRRVMSDETFMGIPLYIVPKHCVE